MLLIYIYVLYTGKYGIQTRACAHKQWDEKVERERQNVRRIDEERKIMRQKVERERQTLGRKGGKRERQLVGEKVER